MKPLIPWRLLLISMLLTFLTAAIPSMASAQTEPPPPPQLERQQLLFHPAEAPIQGTGALSNSVSTDIPAYARLVFQSLRDGDWDIFLGATQSAPETRLTQNTSPDLEPRLNRGATKIVYVSKNKADYEISSMNIDGSQSTELTNNTVDDFAPSWSPDGKKILFSSMRDGQSEIYVMNADGSNQVRLTNDADYDGMPDWSPDGTKIIFISRRTGGYHVWLANADGSAPQQLSAQAYSMHPRWSPDGTQIVYDADSDSNGWQGIWLMNADGSNQHMFLGDDPGSINHDYLAGGWMPDSHSIAVTSIEYTLYRGNWYWVGGWTINIKLDNSYYPHLTTISGGNTDWYPDWQSNDLKAPVSNFGSLPAQSPATFAVDWSAEDVGSAGVDTYDVQVKDSASDSWTPLLTNVYDKYTGYTGLGGHTYSFRVRAIDYARNQEDWSIAPVVSTTVETLPPITNFTDLPEFSPTEVVDVKWSSIDPGNSGIASYNLQYRIGLDGKWQGMFSGMQGNTGYAPYWGHFGDTVYFRVRGIDKAGNVEAWHSPQGNDRVTIYSWKVSGNIFDNSGAPVSSAQAVLSPSGILDGVSTMWGLFSAYGYQANKSYSTTWSKNGYGSPPATIFRTDESVTRDIALPPSDDIIVDGSFEAAPPPNVAWQTSGSLPAPILTNQSHTGAHAISVGQPYWGDIDYSGISSERSSPIVLDSLGTMHFLRIVPDANGGPYSIAYISRTSDGVWSTPADPIADPTAYWARLAVDASNTLHMVWTSPTGTWYATRALGANWSATSRVSAMSLNMAQIAIGPDGQPQIAGLVNGMGIIHTRLTQGFWSAYTIVTHKVPYDFSMQIGLDGTVHLLCGVFENSGFMLYFSQPSGGIWSAEQQISANFTFIFPSTLKIDSEGTLYAFWGTDFNKFEYRIKQNGQEWEAAEPLNPTVFSIQAYQIDFAGNHGKVAMLYKSTGNQQLIYMEKTSGTATAFEQLIATNTTDLIGQLSAGAGEEFHLLYSSKGEFAYRRSYPPKQTGEAVISQTLTVPAGPSAARLSFFYRLGGASTANATGFKVQVQASGITTDLLATQTNTTDWTFQSYDLSAWSGQTVTLSFRTNQVAGNPPTFAFLDDVALGSSYADVWSSLPVISGWPRSLVSTTLTCGNQGGAPASGVDIALTLPEGASLVSAVPAPDSLLPTPTWHIGSVAAKTQGCAIQLQLKLASTLVAPTKLTLQTNLTTSSTELETTNNQMNFDLVIPYYMFYLPQVSR